MITIHFILHLPIINSNIDSTKHLFEALNKNGKYATYLEYYFVSKDDKGKYHINCKRYVVKEKMILFGELHNIK